MTEPLVFPVGHYLGPYHPVRLEPPAYHLIRVGWQTVRLPSESHVDVWALTHGSPVGPTEGPWTSSDVLAAAAEAGIEGAPAILRELHEWRVVVEVGQGSKSAVDFARTHRVQALLVGLGNTPDPAVPDGIGLVGLPPIVQVIPEIFAFWQLAQLWPDLWAACQGMVEVDRELDITVASKASPELMLDFSLIALRTLIVRNAVYLDVTV